MGSNWTMLWSVVQRGTASWTEQWEFCVDTRNQFFVGIGRCLPFHTCAWAFFMEAYALFHTLAANLRKAGKSHNASRHSPVVNNQSLPLLHSKGISRARITWHLCPCVRIHDVALFPLRSVVGGRDRTGNGACRQINLKRSLAFYGRGQVCTYSCAHCMLMYMHYRSMESTKYVH